MSSPDTSRWWDRANCRGLPPEWFVPEVGDPNPQAYIQCSACTVRQECHDDGVVSKSWGVFGGVRLQAGLPFHPRRRG